MSAPTPATTPAPPSGLSASALPLLLLLLSEASATGGGNGGGGGGFVMHRGGGGSSSSGSSEERGRGRYRSGGYGEFEGGPGGGGGGGPGFGGGGLGGGGFGGGGLGGGGLGGLGGLLGRKKRQSAAGMFGGPAPPTGMFGGPAPPAGMFGGPSPPAPSAVLVDDHAVSKISAGSSKPGKPRPPAKTNAKPSRGTGAPSVSVADNPVIIEGTGGSGSALVTSNRQKSFKVNAMPVSTRDRRLHEAIRIVKNMMEMEKLNNAA